MRKAFILRQRLSGNIVNHVFVIIMYNYSNKKQSFYLQKKSSSHKIRKQVWAYDRQMVHEVNMNHKSYKINVYV